VEAQQQQQDGAEAVVVKIYTAKIRNKNVIKGEKYEEKSKTAERPAVVPTAAACIYRSARCK